MNRVKELEEEILRHKALYYQGHPEISDHQYDALEEELKKINPESYVLSLVGGLTTSSNKVEHDKKMLSLDKCYELDDIKKWMSEKECVSTLKIDGVSCSLVYKKGELVLAKTRGDGQFGENITPKILWMPSVPKKIDDLGEFEVRGEMFCDEENFFHLAEEMVKSGEDRPSSQRNIVAGLMGRKEHLEFCRYLRFKAFELIDLNGTEKTEWELHLRLERLGFDAAEMVLHRDTSKIEKVIQEAQEFMSEGDYQIDGLVLSYNSLALQEELGATAHHPRYKIAFKFRGESKVTSLRSITWQVSRNGFLTPVGEVEPVELSGAMISRVTLHNYGQVALHQLKEGDKIEIIRSGEVIPKFLSVAESSGNEFTIPSICPSCEHPVEVRDIRLVCTNEFCPAKLKENILNFIQKIGIDDLSSKRLDEMMNAGLVKKISDLYDLTPEQLLELNKTKEKLATKLYEAIQKSKKVDIITFLSALGISGGAYNKCEKVVRHGHNTIDKIKTISFDDLLNVESFAEKSAQEFLSSLQSKYPLIDELLSKGFDFGEVDLASETPLSGKKICITGALSQKRSMIENHIRQAGAVVVGSVSKNTDYLLTNETDPSSSKFKKALELNIPVITEEKFLSLLGIKEE